MIIKYKPANEVANNNSQLKEQKFLKSSQLNGDVQVQRDRPANEVANEQSVKDVIDKQENNSRVKEGSIETMPSTNNDINMVKDNPLNINEAPANDMAQIKSTLTDTPEQNLIRPRITRRGRQENLDIAGTLFVIITRVIMDIFSSYGTDNNGKVILSTKQTNSLHVN